MFGSLAVAVNGTVAVWVLLEQKNCAPVVGLVIETLGGKGATTRVGGVKHYVTKRTS